HARKRQRYDRNTTVNASGNLIIRLLHSPGYRRNISLARYLDHREVARNFVRSSGGLPRPDLVLASLPTLELAAAGARIAAAADKPFVIGVRDLWPDELIMKFPPSLRGAASVASWPMVWDRNNVVRSASAILAVSQTFLDWALKHGCRSQGEL